MFSPCLGIGFFSVDCLVDKFVWLFIVLFSVFFVGFGLGWVCLGWVALCALRCVCYGILLTMF